jgi:hypothetical protein
MEQRGPDRRRFARGGRRDADRPGYTPLVILIDPDASRRSISEAILSKLRFAVASVDSVEEATRISRALMPEAILCRVNDLQTVRDSALPEHVPGIALSDSTARSEDLIPVVRAALRLQPVRPR